MESQFYWTKGRWTKGQFHKVTQPRILRSMKSFNGAMHSEEA